MEVGGGRPSREQLWESTAVAQGSPQALICIDSSGDGSHPPVSADALHIRYAFNFSFGYYGDADLRDSPANFPEPAGCEEPVPLSCRRNDGASDYSFVTSGGTSNVMKVLFHKK